MKKERLPESAQDSLSHSHINTYAFTPPLPPSLSPSLSHTHLFSLSSRLPESNSLDGLLMLRAAWDICDIAQHQLRFFKVMAKLCYGTKQSEPQRAKDERRAPNFHSTAL